MRTIFVVCLIGVIATTARAQQPADPHAQMKMRGAQAMGFDQDKTTHHFHLYPDGGVIDVSVNDVKDKTNLEAIRSHLPHISSMFGAGNFETPMMVHGTNVPGTAEMTMFKDRVSYTYTETPKGGRVNIVTTDPAALKAVYAFLRFQIADHKTGDSLDIQPKRVS